MAGSQSTEKLKAYNAAYYAANRERLRAQMLANYRAKAGEYKARAAAWAKANPDKRNAINRAYRADHRELFAESNRRDWEKHKPERIAACKEYREQNRGKMRELTAAWKAAHPEANAHHVGLRRTRQMQATPAWADLAAIKVLYKQATDLRRQTGQKWHVDHVVPLKHPLVCGLHVPANLCVIPAADNQSKGNRLTE